MFCEFESRSWRGVLDTPVCDKDGQWLSADQWFSPGSPPIKKNDFHDITELLLKVPFNTITLSPFQTRFGKIKRKGQRSIQIF